MQLKESVKKCQKLQLYLPFVLLFSVPLHGYYVSAYASRRELKVSLVLIVVAFRILFYSPSFSVIVLPCCSFSAQFGPKHFIATLHARVVQSFHFHAICLRHRGQEVDGGKDGVHWPEGPMVEAMGRQR